MQDILGTIHRVQDLGTERITSFSEIAGILDFGNGNKRARKQNLHHTR